MVNIERTRYIPKGRKLRGLYEYNKIERNCRNFREMRKLPGNSGGVTGISAEFLRNCLGTAEEFPKNRKKIA